MFALSNLYRWLFFRSLATYSWSQWLCLLCSSDNRRNKKIRWFRRTKNGCNKIIGQHICWVVLLSQQKIINYFRFDNISTDWCQFLAQNSVFPTQCYPFFFCCALWKNTIIKKSEWNDNGKKWIKITNKIIMTTKDVIKQFQMNGNEWASERRMNNWIYAGPDVCAALQTE